MKAFVLATLMAFGGQAYADGQLILTCNGQLSTEPVKFPSLGKEFKLEISQTPERQDYGWFLRLSGDVIIEERTNGPINADGTTVAPSGEENRVMYQALNGGILLKPRGLGNLQFVDEFPIEGSDQPGYELIEYALSGCERTGVEIDLREAKIYNARSELADLAVLQDRPTWVEGVGVSIGSFGEALGIGVFVKDEEQQRSFIAEFQERGLVLVDDKGEVYYRSIPLDFTITGDVKPIP